MVALLLRLGALAMLAPPPLDTSAELAYWGGAEILLHGKGFSDLSYPVYAPPLYAMFIATCRTLFGDDQIPVKLVQAILDSLTVVVIFLIVKEIFGWQTGILSAAIVAIYPFSIYLSVTIASEPLFTFLLSLFILVALRAFQSGTLSYYCAAGILLALATMTRGVTQFVPIAFLFPLLHFYGPSKKLLLVYGTFCFSFAVIIFPWALRNHIILDDFIPVGTAGGVVFLQGSTEIFFTSDALKVWPDYYKMLLASSPAAPSKLEKPSHVDKFNAKAGMDNYTNRLLNDPLSLVFFLLKKFLRLWYAGESGDNDTIILLVNVPIYLFALAGLLLAWHHKVIWGWVPFGIIGYFIVVHWASLPLFRYMMPVMPCLVGFAAFTIIAVFETVGILHSSDAITRHS